MLNVIKAGGQVLRQGCLEIAEDLKKLVFGEGEKVVFVHGGGVDVTEMAERLGLKQKFVTSPEGFRSRYTDRETVEIYNMVMSGKINKNLVSLFQSLGIPSLGLSGVDGAILMAKRREKMIIVDDKGKRRVSDAGFTGRICKVNDEILRTIVDKGYVPVISPVAISQEFELLNVDSDRAAANIAIAMHADRLIYMTDVEGVIFGGKFLRKLTIQQTKEVLSKIGGGMSTKVQAAAEAVSNGVKEAVIASGKGKFPVLSAIKHLCGTIITYE
ncbi:MAG: [LysW]-aminoadipate/[LysW]-glutamate kinase [Candidatus Bathyarchaeia archaeon]